MSKIFNKLKSLFVVEDSSVSEVKPEPVSQTQTIALVTDSDRPAEVKQEYLEILFKALDENNLEGFDYLEFREALNSLSSVDMDESTRYASALAMAKSMDSDKHGLIESAQTYLQVLTEEEKKFERALNEQINSRIGGNQNSIEELESLISTRKQEIEKLTTEITGLKKRMENKQAQLQEASNKLVAVKADFKASFDFLMLEIKKDLDLIKKL